jgi:hypothetical protein
MGSNQKSAVKLTYGRGRTENRRLKTGNKVATIFEHRRDQSNRRDEARKHWRCCCNLRWRLFQRPTEAHNCRIHSIIDCLIGEHEPTDLLDKFNPKQGQPNKKKRVGNESAQHGICSSNELDATDMPVKITPFFLSLAQAKFAFCLENASSLKGFSYTAPIHFS